MRWQCCCCGFESNNRHLFMRLPRRQWNFDERLLGSTARWCCRSEKRCIARVETGGAR